MKLFLLALLTYAFKVDSQDLRSDTQCYTGTIQVGNETWTENDILADVEAQVTAAVLTVANSEETLANFLKTQGNCQADCLVMMMRPTFSTLYGKLGEDFMNYDNPAVQDTFVEAISGAFKACYPYEPRDEVRQVAQAIFNSIGTNISADPTSIFPQGVACKNEGFEDFFPVEEFLDSFEGTILDVMEMSPRLKTYFDTEAQDCQRTCIEQTVPASATTLFLADNYDPSTAADALTGAIHACFPGVSSEDINLLVMETEEVMADAEEAAANFYNEIQTGVKSPHQKKTSVKKAMKKRRVNRRKKKQEEEEDDDSESEPPSSSDSSSLVLCVGAVVLVSLGAFIGTIAGRHWEKSPIRNRQMLQLLPTSLRSKNDRFEV